MTILGIETSCDETSLALLDAQRKRLVIQKHVVSSQVSLHRKYGGIVPEVAARRHIEVLQPLCAKVIGRRRIADVDLIAVTTGPGLVTSLMIGVQAAKTLSYIFKKPLVGINHLEGHVYSNWLSRPLLVRQSNKFFPALILIASGGHTEFIIMNNHGSYSLLGKTVDDAAGESFDKVAKILNLGYPGGPAVANSALKGNPKAIDFPRPMMHSSDYNVSFSGLKTAVLYYLEKKKAIKKAEVPDVAASFQQAVVDALMTKVNRAITEYSPRSLMFVGGVSANKALRNSFLRIGRRSNVPVFLPAIEFTGDNAAMIAAAGYYRRNEASREAWKDLSFSAQQDLV